MHLLVLQRFPSTPFVYGGSWSWFSEGFCLAFDVIVYPYLPLVLLDRGSVPSGILQQIYDSCARHGVSVLDVSEQGMLMQVLDRLEASSYA